MLDNATTNLSYTLKYVDKDDLADDVFEIEFSLDPDKPVIITIISNLENDNNERILASFEMTRKNWENIIKFYQINKNIERNDIV